MTTMLNELKQFPQLEYRGQGYKGKDLAFRHYNPQQVVMGKPMVEWLKPGLPFWHMVKWAGTDMFGGPTMNRSTAPGAYLEGAHEESEFMFALTEKMSIPYLAAHIPNDVVPYKPGDIATTQPMVDAIVHTWEDLMKSSPTRFLWLTANNFSDPHFMNGAGTTNNADVYAHAAANNKMVVDAAIKVGAGGIVFWDGRGGMHNTPGKDVYRELRNGSYLRQLVIQYAIANGFEGWFAVEPKGFEPMTALQYDSCVMSTLGHIAMSGMPPEIAARILINSEENHASLSGKLWWVEVMLARIFGKLGSLDVNGGALPKSVNFDIDRFPYDQRGLALVMYQVILNGGLPGGCLFDAKPSREDYTMRGLLGNIRVGLDTLAYGLKAAEIMHQDGRIQKFIDEHYNTFETTRLGHLISAQKITLEELAAHALHTPAPLPGEGQELELNDIVNQCLEMVE